MANSPFDLQNGETSDQRYQRFNNDYHSDDRESVLADAKSNSGAFALPAGPQSQNNSQPFNYEGARDAWMSGKYGVGKDAAAAWAKEYGINYNGGDTINLPNGGGSIDIIGNYAGGAGNGRAMTANWTPAGGNGSNPNGQSSSGGYGSSSFSQSGPVHDAKWDELYNTLMTRSKQGLAVNANDPNIRAQADPYAAAQQREARRYMSQQAEHGSPYATGAQLGQERMAGEQASQASGQFEGQLIGREIQSKRDEIQNALTQMGGMLTEEQRLALQKELGYLNDATQRYGIDSNATIAQGQLGLGRDRLGYDIGRGDMDYWLRSQGL